MSIINDTNTECNTLTKKYFSFNEEQNYAGMQERVLQGGGKLKGLTREDFAKRARLQSTLPV